MRPFSLDWTPLDGQKNVAKTECSGTTHIARDKHSQFVFQFSKIRIYDSYTYPKYSEDGMNLLVVSLGEKNAKDYCEIEMLNEKSENARVAAGAAINALKGLSVGPFNQSLQLIV